MTKNSQSRVITADSLSDLYAQVSALPGIGWTSQGPLRLTPFGKYQQTFRQWFPMFGYTNRSTPSVYNVWTTVIPRVGQGVVGNI